MTAGNFLRAAPIALLLSALMFSRTSVDSAGLWYALLSGALTSGIGYAIWYTALPAWKATHAATIQLSVPVIAALGGVAFLGEPITLRLALASAAILGGIALVILEKSGRRPGKAVNARRSSAFRTVHLAGELRVEFLPQPAARLPRR